LERKKRILVAPLDWGLGHATRCIPVINGLLERNCEVIIASNGSALTFLRSEFPDLKFYELSAYAPLYPDENNSMVWKMGMQLPKFIKTIFREFREAEKIVRDEKIDTVISDNRYGCYSRYAKSIFIYHQVNLLMPEGWKWMEKSVNYFNQRQIKKFDECWVPTPSDQFFPELTSTSASVKFIGFLSRFSAMNTPKKYRVMAICSGPEPQRSYFERNISKKLQDANYPTLIVRGIVDADEEPSYFEKDLWVVNYLNSKEMNHVICESEVIICRSGYSTVMDLMKTGSRAIFIPTPGQTEQEYLASELMRKGIAFSMRQSEFNLKKALGEAEKFSGFVNFEHDELLLKNAIDSIL